MTPQARRRCAWLAGTAGLLVVTALAVPYARDAEFNFDEFYFLDAAKNLARHGQYGTFRNGELQLFDPYLSTGPTVIVPVALAFWAWGPDYFLARLYMVGALVLLFVLVYVVTAALHSRAAGVLAGLFLLCVPYVWYFGLHVLGEVPAAVLFLPSVYLLARAERAESSGPAAWLYLGAGLLLGLSALTKLVFFLGVMALGALAALVAIRDRRRAAAVAGGAAVGFAVLAGWEGVQLLILGVSPYLEQKRRFAGIFIGESGLRAWLVEQPPGVLEAAIAAVTANLEVVERQAGLGGLQVAAAIGAVFVQLARTARRRPEHARVTLFLALFFLGYLLWFFLAKHDAWYRLLFPAYLLFGLALGPLLVDLGRALRQPIGLGGKLVCVGIAGLLASGLFLLPFSGSIKDYRRVRGERPARAGLELVAALRRELRPDSKIGYWTWWRAPEVAFFLPNPFFDISRSHNRAGFVPARDFVLGTFFQRHFDPASWTRLSRFCRETVVTLGDNVLCRFGDGARWEARIPAAAASALDFTGGSATREDQLVDGLYEQEALGFRWMAGQARLFLGAAAPKGRIHVAFHLPEPLRAREGQPVALAVTVSDRLVSRFRLTRAGDATVVTDCLVTEGPEGLLRVELATDRSFVPKEIGLNDDMRDLSLHIRRVEFRPDDRC